MAKDKATKEFSTKQEKLIASLLDGKVVPASGARPTNPGDVSSWEWLAECKTHVEPGHTIMFNHDVWKKICDEAMAVHRKPVLIVDNGSQKEKFTWCLCRPFNIDRSRLLELDFPVAVKKNASAKHDKLNDVMTTAIKPYVGAFYIGGYYSLKWDDEDVVILPLSTFKEVLDN